MKMHRRIVLHYLILLFALFALAPWNTCAEQPTSTPDELISLLKQGIAYCQGDGVKKDEAKGAELIGGAIGKGVQKLAAQGNAEAQYELGECYLWGYGVDVDEAEAIKWYRKAAEQGHADARYILGEFYYNGIGVNKDLTEAAKWYLLAAEHGHAKAQYDFGRCYSGGEGVDKDAAQAVTWYRRAADNGNANAMYALGKCYLEGTGVEKDEKQAAKWLCNAAHWGNTDAKELLRKLEPEEAAHLYRLAAESGYTYAKYALGKCHLEGTGTAKDAAQAAKWICRAAREGNPDAKELLYRLADKQGNAEAQYELGDRKDYTGDYTEAVKWYRKAAEQGHANAQYELGDHYYRGW